MVVSEFSSQCFQFIDLRLQVLSSLFFWERAGVCGAFGDAFVGRGAVGVGSYCEVVGSAEGDDSILKADDVGEQDDEELIFAIGPYCFNKFEIRIFGSLYLQLLLLGFPVFHCPNFWLKKDIYD